MSSDHKMKNQNTRKTKTQNVYRGFANGFTAPFLVFGRRPMVFSYRRGDTVNTSWREVGHELADATQTEGRKLGKTSGREDGKLVANRHN